MLTVNVEKLQQDLIAGRRVKLPENVLNTWIEVSRVIYEKNVFELLGNPMTAPVYRTLLWYVHTHPRLYGSKNAFLAPERNSGWLVRQTDSLIQCIVDPLDIGFLADLWMNHADNLLENAEDSSDWHRYEWFILNLIDLLSRTHHGSVAGLKVFAYLLKYDENSKRHSLDPFSRAWSLLTHRRLSAAWKQLVEDRIREIVEGDESGKVPYRMNAVDAHQAARAYVRLVRDFPYSPDHQFVTPDFRVEQVNFLFESNAIEQVYGSLGNWDLTKFRAEFSGEANRALRAKFYMHYMYDANHFQVDVSNVDEIPWIIQDLLVAGRPDLVPPLVLMRDQFIYQRRQAENERLARVEVHKLIVEKFLVS